MCWIGGEVKRLVKTPRPCGAAFMRELRLHPPTTGLESNGFEPTRSFALTTGPRWFQYLIRYWNHRGPVGKAKAWSVRFRSCSSRNSPTGLSLYFVYHRLFSTTVITSQGHTDAKNQLIVNRSASLGPKNQDGLNLGVHVFVYVCSKVHMCISYRVIKATSIYIYWEVGWDIGLTAFLPEHVFPSEREKQKMWP